MKLGKKLKTLREFRNLSQEHVAEKLDISQSNYSKIENGNSDIPYSKLEEFASLMGIGVEDIIGFNENLVFNLRNNKKSNGLAVNQVSPNEKKLYDDYIRTLQTEIAYLKTMVDSLLNKISPKTK